MTSAADIGAVRDGELTVGVAAGAAAGEPEGGSAGTAPALARMAQQAAMSAGAARR